METRQKSQIELYTQAAMPGTETMQSVTEPAKLVTLLALNSFGSGEQVGYTDIAERATAMQGDTPARIFTKSVVSGYCEGALRHAGFTELEMDLRPARHYYGPSTKVLLTKKGWRDGVPLAGAFLKLQVDAPGQSFLEDALGTKVEPGKPNPRPLLYHTLLLGHCSIGELVAQTGLTQPTVSRHVTSLVELGILDKIDLCDPANRRYTIVSDPTNHRSSGGILARSFVELVAGFYDKGHREITGGDLLRRACRVHPDLPPQEIWNSIRRLGKSTTRAPFIQAEEQHELQRSIVRIPAANRPHIAKIFDIWRLLSEDRTKAEVVAFRRAARMQAAEFASSPARMRKALACSKVGATALDGQADWLAASADIVAGNGSTGIETQELYGQLLEALPLPGRISEATFRQWLNKSDIIDVTSRPLIGRGGGKRVFTATIARKSFPADWQSEAACRNEDPDLFFPPDGVDFSASQAEKAKTVCRACPVRMACLRTAIDEDSSFGVQGGYWMEQRELGPALRTAISEAVEIGKRRVV